MEKSMHDLEANKQKLDQKTEEHDPAKNNDVVESVTTKCTNSKQCGFSTQQHEDEKQLIVLKAEKVVVDENDKRLEDLRKEWGKEAYRAVVDTLVDLNEYNSGLRYSIPEIWNFDEGRRAHLKEVIQYLFQQWETHRKKDTNKYAAIVDLMADKERLIKRLTDFNALMGEKDKLLAEKNAAIGKLMAQDADKVKLIDKLSAKNNALLDAEKRKTQRLKQQIQKLAWELHSQKEELGKQTKELTGRKRNNYGDKETVEMNMESMDWCFGSLLDQGEILPKNLEDCTAPKSKEQNSSTSEDKKSEDQTMGQSYKCLEVEPDMLGKQLEGRSDVLGVLEPTNHPHHLPMVAMFSTPSQSMTWEAIYQMACVEYESPKTEM